MTFSKEWHLGIREVGLDLLELGRRVRPTNSDIAQRKQRDNHVICEQLPGETKESVVCEISNEVGVNEVLKDFQQLLSAY